MDAISEDLESFLEIIPIMFSSEITPVAVAVTAGLLVFIQSGEFYITQILGDIALSPTKIQELVNWFQQS